MSAYELPTKESGEVDAARLSQLLGERVASAQLEPDDRLGGLSADFLFVRVRLEAGDERRLVAKTTRPASLARAARLGTAREALFYAELAPRLRAAGVPDARHAAGDVASGEMLILMDRPEGAVPVVRYEETAG